MILLATLLAAASPSSCTPDTATPTNVREIAREPAKWFGRCVRLEGYVLANFFFEDVAGYYRIEASDKDDRPNDGWLGLYFRTQGNANGRLRRASVVGSLESCERHYAAAEARLEPGEIVFLTGYCHYRGGLVLDRVEPAFGAPVRFSRPAGERARVTFGDLVPASTENQVPEAVEAKVSSWRTAFLAGDTIELRNLVHPYDWTPERKPKAARRLDAILTGATGPFRQLGGRGLQAAYFSERLDEERRTEGESGDWFACFCKSADCSGRWPIAATDAKALDRLPYVCLRIGESRDGKKRMELGLERFGDRLIEPRHRDD